MRNFGLFDRKPLRSGIKFLSLVLVTLLCSWESPDFLNEIQQKYDRYISTYPQVKIDLTFNQPVYALGDTAFFNAFYLDESFLPIKGSHTITLDLISGDKQTKQRIKFKVQDGSGYNQIPIKNDLAPGEYKIVAYSEWMRNFSPKLFFQKKIQIVSRRDVTAKRNSENDSIRFFPEGGNLIRDLNTQVAVTGPPLAVFLIKNNSGDEIKKIALDSTGFGVFDIVASANQSYFAQQVTNEIKWTLPPVASDGIAFRCKEAESNKVQISIPPKSQWLGKNVFVVFVEKGKIIFKREILIEENQPVQLEIPQKTGRTVLHLYAFSGDGKVLSERTIVTPFRKSVDVKLELPSNAAQRGDVSGEIKILDESGSPLPSQFSISVVQKQFFKMSPLADLLFSDFPELKSRIEMGLQPDIGINDFLISQKGRINWNEVLADKLAPKSKPFQDQIQFKGRVVSKKTGLPSPDSTVVITYLQRNLIGYEGITKNGEFQIPFIFDFSGEDNIFCTLQSKSKVLDEDYTILISRDSLSQNESWTSAESGTPSIYGEYVFNKKMISNSYLFFNGKERDQYNGNSSPNKNFEDEFLGADFSINVKDYVAFPKMSDLMVEIVPFVQYRKTNSDETIRMTFRAENSVKKYKNSPLYIIDGAMTRSTEFFLKIKPEDVLTIKIINNPGKLVQLGKLGENGIIFIESKNRNLSNLLTGQNLFPVVGLSTPVLPSSIGNSKNRNDKSPDLRSTLYWNPLIKTSSSGKASINFSTSDDVGKMRVLIKGLTEDGRPFSEEKEFEVGFQSQKK